MYKGEKFQKLVKSVRASVNYIAAVMVLIIFLAFCANVILRYTLGVSFGWIVEFSLILWLWVIFLGAGIFLEDEDHVSFIYMYRAFSKEVSIVLKTLSYAVIFIGGVIMLLPVWDYIGFLKIRASDVIGIPMNYVFLIYKIFLVALVMRYGYKLTRNLYMFYQYLVHTRRKKIEKEKT